MKELEYAIVNVETYLRTNNCNLESFNLIKQSLTPPTEQEVCEALNKASNNVVNFKHENGVFKSIDMEIYFENGYIKTEYIKSYGVYKTSATPEMYELLGKFYKGG